MSLSTDAFSPAAFPRLGGADAGAERARERLRGYADGHAEGFRAAAAEAGAVHRHAEDERQARDAASAREVATALAALEAASRSLAERERALATVAHTDILRYAVELAETLLVGELSDDDRSATAAVRRALAVVDAGEIRAVRLHPDDLLVLERLAEDTPAFVLVPDETLTRGDAVAVLAHGHLDARIGSALKRARDAVTGGEA